ncbi:DNA ligase D [Piscinibacter sakaiensis]|uniref:DNA ligase D n=1 Tax=Piscinibacter sakaiensis TaxID=1547922 RepID=UPI003AAFC039
MASDKLDRYRSKRDFGKTPEPQDEPAAARPKKKGKELAFVVQKHAASRLHYDFRLELDGVMLSWAVPKGPSFDPKDKRLAVQTEDHPISYNSFEGTIPKGQYGAGTVIVWDRGSWVPEGDPHKGLADGKLLFTLHGHKLAGLWELVRIAKGHEKQPPWILFKKHDEFERPHADYDVITALPDSVVSKPPPGPPQPWKSVRGSGFSRDSSPATQRSPSTLLASAPKTSLPATLAPQLATPSTSLPSEANAWLYEIKFDGYRLLTRIDEKGKPKLLTRNGHDWTTKMPRLARELAAQKIKNAWLDGEIVVLNDDGLPDFGALQLAFDGRKASDAIVYFLFDLPFLDGRDLRKLPQVDRRRLLQHRLQQALPANADGGALRLSAELEGSPADLFASASRLGLEGLIAKRCDAPYRSARSNAWLKLKTRLRQEFVVAGFTDRGGQRGAAEIGSLLLGVFDAKRLVSVGSVGTGWNGQLAADLKKRLVKIERDKPPFADGAAAVGSGRFSKRSPAPPRWVEPKLIAEVEFAEWTSDGQVRHASFLGLRDDKPAKQVVREENSVGGASAPIRAGGSQKIGAEAPPTKNQSKASPQMKITNPDRVIDEKSGLTKLDLVRYYDSVADWMLPHLKGRPCSLVRGPNGIGGELFFQKHAESLKITGLKQLDPAIDPEHEPLISIPSATALVGAAQMNVIEIHTWNALARRFETPDRIVFDLDPGEGVGWKKVQEAARLLHSFLDDLGLKAWLKTSGGKGLHIVVPIAAKLDWETVKGFSRDVVQHIAKVIPDRFVAKSGPKNRVGKIYIDYLRNSQGATTVAAFSARARPGLGVSMPVAWEQLDEIKSGDQWTIANTREYLSFEKNDPWAGYWKSRQGLAKAVKRLGG